MAISTRSSAPSSQAQQKRRLLFGDKHVRKHALPSQRLPGPQAPPAQEAVAVAASASGEEGMDGAGAASTAAPLADQPAWEGGEAHQELPPLISLGADQELAGGGEAAGALQLPDPFLPLEPLHLLISPGGGTEGAAAGDLPAEGDVV